MITCLMAHFGAVSGFWAFRAGVAPAGFKIQNSAENIVIALGSGERRSRTDRISS
jgi:predicted Zn-dependent protease